MKHVAIIPARAGSKSITNKNLQKIKGKTLVDRAIDAAKEAGLFDQIVVSTDIPILLDELSADPKLTVIHRKSDLATDEAMMAGVVLDALAQAEIPNPHYFWLLQPTSPFRSKSHFTEVEALIARHRPMSLISVKDVGPNHPNRTYTIVRNELKPLRFTNFDNKQTLKEVYIRNGSFYVCHAGEFRKHRNFYIDPCVPYVMGESDSINIDGPLDLALAQQVAKR